MLDFHVIIGCRSWCRPGKEPSTCSFIACERKGGGHRWEHRGHVADSRRLGLCGLGAIMHKAVIKT